MHGGRSPAGRKETCQGATAHCHGAINAMNLPAGAKRIVLVGNPNVGKSVVFNRITGAYVDVSNYPGTTIEVSHGGYNGSVIIDTPGIYGVSSFNDEERVARDVILDADVIINIVDTVHLERDLFLTLQLIDMGKPVVVALNMYDEVRVQGLEIDVGGLEQLLGVRVVPTVAPTGEGIDDILQAAESAGTGNRSLSLVRDLRDLSSVTDNEAEGLMILEGDEYVSGLHNTRPGGRREEIYLDRRQRVNAIVDQILGETDHGASLKVRVGRWMVRPLTGIPILAVILYAVYQVIGVFVAQTVVGVTEETLMQGYYEPFVRGILEGFIDPGSWIYTVLAGEFGVATMTVTYLIGLLLPLIIGFYLVLSLMEDSGYLPRLAVLVDRTMTGVGLNGRAVIPMILGLGCVTMATVTTRLLGNKREKIIMTFLLALAIPCSAQLGVITAMVAPLGATYLLLYAGVILGAFGAIGLLLNRFMPGESTDLFIDLPPLRLPRLNNVVMKTWTKTKLFMLEAGPYFFYGALIISAAQITGLLSSVQDWVAPLTVGWLGLPREAATAFIMGIVRRDFGAAGLYGLSMTSAQTLVSLVTITLFVPCVASVMVIWKERGTRMGMMIWLGTFALAFIIGGLVSRAMALVM